MFLIAEKNKSKKLCPIIPRPFQSWIYSLSHSHSLFRFYHLKTVIQFILVLFGFSSFPPWMDSGFAFGEECHRSDGVFLVHRIRKHVVFLFRFTGSVNFYYLVKIVCTMSLYSKVNKYFVLLSIWRRYNLILYKHP